jgi:hypothetical protein
VTATGSLAVMQPYLFPYIGYFQLIAAADRFVLYDDVNFIKQGWINRNNILVNGAPYRFTVPIQSVSSFVAINEVLLDPRLYPAWREKFLKTLTQAYAKAPHFQKTFELVKSVLDPFATHVVQLAYSSVEAVCGHVGIPTTIVPSSSIYRNNELRAQERILDICRQEGAAHYINAQGGVGLYDRVVFKEHGFKLSFVQPVISVYPQGKSTFVPGLSIIDVLMFNSPEKVRTMVMDTQLN